jgi:hypothetical protein
LGDEEDFLASHLLRRVGEGEWEDLGPDPILTEFNDLSPTDIVQAVEESIRVQGGGDGVHYEVRDVPRIKIIAVPPGFAPPEIRERWVGVEIPTPTDDELRANRPSSAGIGHENEGGYLVRRESAIQALRAAGKESAARFWELIDGEYLAFSREYCVAR